MDLYPEDFKEQLDEALEFAKYLKERGLWEDNMRIYKDENGNLVAEWNRIFICKSRTFGGVQKVINSTYIQIRNNSKWKKRINN